jgi:hypothetical protein
LVRGRPLYTGRRPRVAVLESGKWSHPADPMAAMPPRYSRFVEAPKLMAHGAGRVWRAVQSRISTAQKPHGFLGEPRTVGNISYRLRRRSLAARGAIRFRYMLDAAAVDTGIVTDHNAVPTNTCGGASKSRTICSTFRAATHLCSSTSAVCVEIYQGYRANYEYEGAPRGESQDYHVNSHGPYRAAGFYWNALAKAASWERLPRRQPPGTRLGDGRRPGIVRRSSAARKGSRSRVHRSGARREPVLRSCDADLPQHGMIEAYLSKVLSPTGPR